MNFLKTQFFGVAADLKQCPQDNLPEIVISGRSNVGKSSLINTIAGQKQLARVSSTPGKTRLVIYFNVENKLYLTDLPGYGFAKVSQAKQADFSALVDLYLTGNRPIRMVLHLLDVRHKPSQLDIQMLAWLEANNLPFRVILTKCDKLSRAQLVQQVKVLAKELDLEDDVNMITFSATNRLGLHELRSLIAAQVGEDAAFTD
ncbi:MAG: ribosome biogenesis GTP-binding protein YihA/YsxC [Eubacteriales bacterium]|nr:ribosome biogenesis GTP-binding protein YihA/YsxC [Eubacteriales bacterium]